MARKGVYLIVGIKTRIHEAFGRKYGTGNEKSRTTETIEETVNEMV
jgi:hypothetical protein